MSAEKQYVIVDCSDWSGVFINGALIYEGHSIPPGWMLDIVIEYGGRVDRYCHLSADEAWMEDMGNFPIDLREVVLADGSLLPAGLLFNGPSLE